MSREGVSKKSKGKRASAAAVAETLHESTTSEKDWSIFGWHGFQLRVPAEWELGALDGDHANGYVRLDDELQMRLEIKWERAKGKEPAREIASRFIKQIEKKAKKAKESFKVRRNVQLVKLDGFDYELFSCQAGVRTFNLLTRCSECNRVTLMRIFEKPNERLKQVCRNVFASFRDHPDGNTQLWSVYGFQFKVPVDYKLHKSTLRTGQLAFEFFDKTGTLDVCRFSVASIVLKENSLPDWFAREFRKKLKSFEFDLEETEAGDHTLYHLTGRTKLSRHVREIFQSRRTLDGWIWVCPENDKIFIIRGDQPGKKALDTGQIAQSIKCCSQESVSVAILQAKTTSADA